MHQRLERAVGEVQGLELELRCQILVGPRQDEQHAELNPAQVLPSRRLCLRGLLHRPLPGGAQQLVGDAQQHELLAREEVRLELGRDVQEEEGCTCGWVALLQEGIIALVPQMQALVENVPPNALPELDDHACHLLENDGVTDDAAAARPFARLREDLPRDQELQELTRGHAEVHVEAGLLDEAEGAEEVRVVGREVRVVQSGQQHHPGTGEAVEEVLDHLLTQPCHVGNQFQAVGLFALHASLGLGVPSLHKAPQVLTTALEAALHEGAVELHKVDQRVRWVEDLQCPKYQGEGVTLPAEQRDLSVHMSRRRLRWQGGGRPGGSRGLTPLGVHGEPSSHALQGGHVFEGGSHHCEVRGAVLQRMAKQTPAGPRARACFRSALLKKTDRINDLPQLGLVLRLDWCYLEFVALAVLPPIGYILRHGPACRILLLLLRGDGVREDPQVALQRDVGEVAVHDVQDCVGWALLQVTFVQEHDPVVVARQLVQQGERTRQGVHSAEQGYEVPRRVVGEGLQRRDRWRGGRRIEGPCRFLKHPQGRQQMPGVDRCIGRTAGLVLNIRERQEELNDAGRRSARPIAVGVPWSSALLHVVLVNPFGGLHVDSQHFSL
mmetsp:Transcript_93612/g.302985  ORF Transcript_93612/g.302985 Transcript_93612/m.302985 type:complete len:609 (-) Transcript_93612:3644-5470(-)